MALSNKKLHQSFASSLHSTEDEAAGQLQGTVCVIHQGYADMISFQQERVNPFRFVRFPKHRAEISLRTHKMQADSYTAPTGFLNRPLPDIPFGVYTYFLGFRK